MFFFKQKTAYEMRISDWSSDGCSSDLPLELGLDDLLDHRLAQIVVGDILVVLGRQDDGVDRRGPAVLVDDRDLRLRIGAQPAQTAGLAIARAAGRERVGQYVKIEVVTAS